MDEKEHDDDGLGQLQPWDPQLGQTEEHAEVDGDPLEEEPEGLGVVVDDAQPVVQLPCPQQHVDAAGVVALCRSIEDGEGY